ncbi:ammonium transporter [Pseudactinotalea sp. HY158]|uniref:ammonium transporter n=1 Tax=Pseudactinotalea sp. HY158 TaxID=2654547 RepID=UPI00129C2D80|nr:ammonium transporter [Pseudactinotalea sp. HY158]QGH69810.1 ammonium transporter [Pseudactinotalea sp. HY158]
MDSLDAPTVWTMVAAALVLLMTPGLAFFYGGMTRVKAALNMLMMSFVAIGIVGVVWVLWGQSIAAGDEFVPGLAGNPFSDLGSIDALARGDLLLVGFSATFAIIAVALISGAVADRARFGAWCLFVPLWVTLVYAPVAFMVWGTGGLMRDGVIGRRLGEAIDFAGGTVVHINAGVAALVLCLVLGARRGFGTDQNQRPHNLPLVMLGAGILWFGWFGFNAGAAADGAQAGLIWINTLVAPGAAMLSWLVVERFRDGHATTLGAASGVVAGLVAVTPTCANITPAWAIVLGACAGVASAFAVGLKYRLGYDDSLDVVGVHLVSGIVGTVALGFIASPAIGRAGLFYGGGPGLLAAQVVTVLVTVVFGGLVTWAIAALVDRTIGFRVDERSEVQGIDLGEHAETAYSFASGTSGQFSVRG